ncbi:hypothetical protein BUALT_Bualt08G0042800 [Buddleja alternifolia]|uniref:Uncharacterized protein n=1 Tax=Buddleja alternifolia TaxID=168488 RepID=A0AAV6XEE8_9LAMI|nr:hypothetical protein BUALT_Bualt08G0042800 [Buddleja alternifolia]
MELWDKMMIPMQKVWIKLSKRVGLHKTGLVKLRQDVRTCEYEDVHILWDMLKRNDTDLTRTREECCWNRVRWAQSATNCSAEVFD